MALWSHYALPSPGRFICWQLFFWWQRRHQCHGFLLFAHSPLHRNTCSIRIALIMLFFGTPTWGLTYNGSALVMPHNEEINKHMVECGSFPKLFPPMHPYCTKMATNTNMAQHRAAWGPNEPHQGVTQSHLLHSIILKSAKQRWLNTEPEVLKQIAPGCHSISFDQLYHLDMSK